MRSELDGRTLQAVWRSEFVHKARLIGVPCGGAIFLLTYERTNNFPVEWDMLAHCDRCRQTAVWNG